MTISRRTLLHGVGRAAAARLAIPSLREFSLADLSAPSHASQPGGPILLNKNENAFGPSEKVMTAMREGLGLANRFPDSESDALISKIANLHRVKPDQVILGGGSTEILRMAAVALLGPGKKLVTTSPTFDAMVQYARTTGAEVLARPLNKEFSHDLNAMLTSTDASTGLVYICNPNNPTGILTTRKDLETFLRGLPATTHILIDEAYHHYVGGSSAYASFIDRSLDDRRVIVTRTFSKIYGLAGIRIGYAIATSEMARRISSYPLLNDVNVIAVRAAATALDDEEHIKVSARRNADDRQEFFNQANARMLRAIDSHTNFVMLNTGRPSEEVAEHFRKNNILVAHGFASMDRYIRVSLGRPEEMLEFWRVWDLLAPHKMSM
jgi:histidinol-phosphate aminotransferase